MEGADGMNEEYLMIEEADRKIREVISIRYF
jgi:hypothetical protein